MSRNHGVEMMFVENRIGKHVGVRIWEYIYSQTKYKWSVPLKIALMNWLFETWTR